MADPLCSRLRLPVSGHAEMGYLDLAHQARWETARCGLCGGLGHPHEDA